MEDLAKDQGEGMVCVWAEHQLSSLPSLLENTCIKTDFWQEHTDFLTSEGTNWNLLLHFTNVESLLKTEEW